MAKKPYAAPSVTAVGSLHELTLVHNKYGNLIPDGVVYHPTKGGPGIPLSS